MKTFKNDFRKMNFIKPVLRFFVSFSFLFFLAVFAQAQINYNTTKYCPSDPPTTFTTVATTYGPLSPGTGNCGFPSGSYDPNLYAAINSNTGGGGDDYQNGIACGACAAAHDASSGKSVTVMIVDSCPSCSTADQLDLGPTAWSDLTNGASPGIANITWNFVPCPLSLMTGDPTGNIEYEWKTGCSGFYDPIQFMDMLFPITSVGFATVNTGPFTALVMGASGVGGNEYWGPTSGNLNGTTGPFYFDVTDGRGNSVTLGPINVGACGVTNGAGAQEQGCGPTSTPTPTVTGTIPPTSTPTTSPTPNVGVGCIYNLNDDGVPNGTGTYNYGPCTFTQNTSIDSCPPTNGVALNAPQTEAINEFYTFGGSNEQVLYCGGSSFGAGTAASTGSAGVQTLPITMSCAPPTGATIQAAFLDVVEYSASSAENGPPPCTTSVDLGGAATPVGVVAGLGNLWNIFIDPRYGDPIAPADYPDNTAYNIRYNVTGLVSLNTLTYTFTDPNICANFAVWGVSLAIVYTIPDPGVCGAVALDDGLFYWDAGDGNLREGVTPFAPTVDWSCMDPTTSCGTNQFSIFGGSQYGFNDGIDTGVTRARKRFPLRTISTALIIRSGATVPLSDPAATEWNTPAIFDQPIAFVANYNGVPMSGVNKITWGLGYANLPYKQEYYVNMLAAGCNAPCVTPTFTNTPTNTNTNTPTHTPTPTPTNTPTNTPTHTNTPYSHEYADEHPTPYQHQHADEYRHTHQHQYADQYAD